MGTTSISQDDVVDVSSSDGVNFFTPSTPLTRLHYFDGKFLRADAFTLEQDYNRTAVRLANLAGGWGVAEGLGVSLGQADAGMLVVGAGLAITAAGNLVYAVGDLQAPLTKLLSVAAPAPLAGNADFAACAPAAQAGTPSAAGPGIYEITVGPVQGLCGNEAVFGKICESACVSDSQRPYWSEGVALRLRPITLQLPASAAVTLTSTHLRNRVASAYFASEPWLTASALGASGLDSDLWCNPATAYGRDEVVIGLLVRDGATTRVIDAWSGRRERMDTQARGYWQGRMAMRPWNVFTAQVLQFQCQLAGLFDGTGGITSVDDCEQIRQLLDSTRTQIDALHKRYSDGALRILQKFGSKPSAQDAQTMIAEIKGSYADLYEISNGLAGADLGAGPLPKNRQLLDNGFVELPPAGYLPVVPGQQALADQLSRVFGEGVALTYHAVRHDEIAELVEEAQHLDRISLTRGLDDPSQVEQVEIFVPDGQVSAAVATAPGEWWRIELARNFFVAFDVGLKTQEYAAQQVAKPAPAAPGLFGEMPVAALRKHLGAFADDADAATTAPSPAPKRKAASGAASSRQTVATPAPAAPAQFDDTPVPVLAGLVRTGPGQNGGFAFTLIVSLETAATAELQIGVVSSRRMDMYIGADISADPFTLARGAQAQIRLEMRVAATSSNGAGTLTVIGDATQADGKTARIVQVDVTSSDGTGIARLSGAIALRRGGDAGAGTYHVDGSPHDATRSPVEFDWSSGPRQATMFILDLAKQITITEPAQGKQVAGGGTGVGTTTGDMPAGTPHPLMEMRGLAAMPGFATPLGAAAMNALIRLGDQTDDDAFVARARDRLFPAVGKAPEAVVSAVLDWVMFRRRRTLLCCPAAAAPVITPGVDAFELWHVEVKSDDELTRLKAALDKGGTKALRPFAFRQVGVLRYGDAQTTPMESPASVLAMWQELQPAPGPVVALGRYWEDAPATGQGWQNNFRLTAMLRQIAAITKPPAAGSGAIAPLANLSAPLFDKALDGGMLVVTRTLPVVRHALLAWAFVDPTGAGHSIDGQPVPVPVVFTDDALTSGDLVKFFSNRPPSTSINAVALATRGTPDAGAEARLKIVLAALAKATTISVPARTGQIAGKDVAALTQYNAPAGGYDEVIYIEVSVIIG